MTEDFWALLDERERDDFTQRAGRRSWRRGEVLFHEGDESEWVLVLLSGRVKASSHSVDGVETVLAVRGPGALLGELSAVDDQPRSASVQAVDQVTALVMPPTEFAAYLQTHGRVAYLLMRLLSDRLRDADRKRVEFGTQDTTGRVAARLVELADRFGTPSDEGIKIGLPLSQDELASWIGASREAVTKALAVLRGAGWIRTGRMSVIVLDVAALRDRAGSPAS